MKTREGLLRYDRLDLDQWCFDMEHEIIPVHTGMEIRVRLLDDRFQCGQLLETPDGGLTVIFSSRKKDRQSHFVLAQDKWYPAKMSAATVEEILGNAYLLDREHELEREDSELDTGESDNLYF